MPRRILQTLRTLPPGIYLLALLTLIGLVTGIYRLAVGLGTSTNLNQSYPWGLWIGFDLFLVAFSGGAFTLAALVYVFHLEEFHPAIRPTVLTGLLGYISVLVILVMDLGRWDRFYHFIIYPNINSALFEVSWCILLYSIVLVSEFSPVLFERYHRYGALRFIRRITVPLVIIGVTLSTLHQSSLGSLFVVVARRLHPLWYTPITPILFSISSVAAGLAMVIAGANLRHWLFRRSLKPQLLGQLGWFLPWVLGLYLIARLGEMLAAGKWGQILTSGRYTTLFLVEMGVGFVLPLILFAIRGVRQQRGWALLGAALVLAGVFINRFNAAWWAMQPTSGFNYRPHWIEVAIQVGVLSGAALVYALVARSMPLFEGTVRPDDDTTELVAQPGHPLAG